MTKLIYLPKESKKRAKKSRKGQKSAWKNSTMNDLVDSICSNEYAKKRLIFTNNKASNNAEIYQKIISEVRKRCEEREELYKYKLQQTRSKFKALVSIFKRIVMLCKTLSGIKNFIEEKGYGKWFFYFAFANTNSRIVSANKRSNLLHHCRRSKTTTSSVLMMRRMKIVAPFQVKVKKKQRKSLINNLFVPKRKKKRKLYLLSIVH